MVTRTEILLSAIDNALRNGSYMTGANLAFEYLCDELGVERDELPLFDPTWSRSLPDVVVTRTPPPYSEQRLSLAMGRVQSFCGGTPRPHVGHVWTSEPNRWCPGDEVSR